MPGHPSVHVDPPLEPAEVDFIASFASEARDREGVRRVWPGQPSRRCPWRPSDDGSMLLLDESAAVLDPDSVASWLRFLSREFLAPSTAASMDAALDEGLRGGHRLTGTVDVGDRRISVDLVRVADKTIPPPESDAIVVDLVAWRHHDTEA